MGRPVAMDSCTLNVYSLNKTLLRGGGSKSSDLLSSSSTSATLLSMSSSSPLKPCVFPDLMTRLRLAFPSEPSQSGICLLRRSEVRRNSSMVLWPSLLVSLSEEDEKLRHFDRLLSSKLKTSSPWEQHYKTFFAVTNKNVPNSW